jgi:hypothetical protein
MTLVMRFFMIACGCWVAAPGAEAASRTLKAGDVMGISENFILSGDDFLDVRGTAEKPCRIDANCQQIKTSADWRGWIKVSHCEFRSLGSAKLPALDLASYGVGDRIVIENSEFHACGAIHLANHDNSATIFRRNILHANSMVPVTNLPSESPPGFRAMGRSPARKFFQGNQVRRSIVQFENTCNWQIGGDKDDDANLLIGMRASLSIHASSDMRVRGNYIHTEIPSFRWSQVHALAVVSPCPGLIVEHNIIRHGQWVVRGITGEFRYNLVLDADAHNFIIGPSGKCHIHHNIFARYCTVDPNLNATIGVIYKADDIQIYNNTFDGGGKEIARRWHVPVIEVGAAAFLASLRNNVFYNHPTKVGNGTAIVRPGFTEKLMTPGPARLGYADHNLFHNPDAAAERRYGVSVADKVERADAGFAKNDVFADPKFKGPIPTHFPFSDADIRAGKVTVSKILGSYREAYAPAAGSPLLNAGDPRDGKSAFIGAVGAGKETPRDEFGSVNRP